MKKSTSPKVSPPSNDSHDSLLGNVAHTLGDAMAGVVGAAAETVTELVKEEEPPKRARPKAVKKTSRRKAVKHTAKTSAKKSSAKPKRATARSARKTRRKA